MNYSILPADRLKDTLAVLRAGDTLSFGSGVYRLAEKFIQFPGGTVDAPITYKSNTRVLLTGMNDERLGVNVGDYVRMGGLWFGGSKEQGEYGHQLAVSLTGTHKQIRGCTFWGYPVACIVGWGEQITIQGNYFINCGNGASNHAVYLSTGTPTQGRVSSRIVCSDNIFVGDGTGSGEYGIHVRAPGSTIARNFIAAQRWGIALATPNNVASNNVLWRMTGAPDPTVGGPWGMFIGNAPQAIVENKFGPHAYLNISELGKNLPGLTLFSNSFSDEPWRGGRPMPAWGEDAQVLHMGNELEELGVAADDLDTAVVDLQSAFRQTAEQIQADMGIDYSFAVLQRAVK